MTSWSSVGGLGRSRGLCWRSCATLGAYVGGLGPLLGPVWAVLGCSWGLRGRSWPLSGPLLAVLCRSWGLCWRSWAALGTFVGGPGPSWAEKCEEHSYLENVLISRAGARSAAWGSVLSCSWGLCGRSWAALGTYVGGLVPLSGPKLAVLGGLGAKVSGLGSDQGEMWPKPERELDPTWHRPHKPPEAP